MTSVKGDILSAFHSTTRRVLGGAAISAVLLGAGAGAAFAGDIDNSGSQNPTFADQSNNAIAGNGAAGGDGGAGGATTNGGNGGAGGNGGSIGANAPTQNYNNQQQLNAVDQTATVTGDGNTVGQASENNFAASSNQQGAGSTAGMMDSSHGSSSGSKSSSKSGSNCGCDSSTSYHESKGYKAASHQSSSNSSTVSGDNTPVGAADTGDGSFVNAADASGLGGDVALGGAISAAALLGAYGVSIARRRHAAHAGV